MERKLHWEGIYGTKRPTDVSWYQREPQMSLSLIEFAGVATSACLIDVGGGTSTLVDALWALGYQHLTVLDISATALEQARQRLAAASSITWIEADVTTVALPSAAFDLWHDRALFHFLTQEKDRASYAHIAQHALKPGGHLIVATFAEDGPTHCSDLEVMRYDPHTLCNQFGASFRLVTSRRELHHTPFDTTQSFIYCHLQKM
jgi:ubiquinone/menaquinone biosynthesis C-methylase UbiE